MEIKSHKLNLQNVDGIFLSPPTPPILSDYDAWLRRGRGNTCFIVKCTREALCKYAGRGLQQSAELIACGHLPQQVQSHKNLIMLLYPDYLNSSTLACCKVERWSKLVCSVAGIQKLLVLYSEVYTSSRKPEEHLLFTQTWFKVGNWDSDLGYNTEISKWNRALSFPIRLPCNLHY